MQFSKYSKFKSSNTFIIFSSDLFDVTLLRLGYNQNDLIDRRRKKFSAIGEFSED